MKGHKRFISLWGIVSLLSAPFQSQAATSPWTQSDWSGGVGSSTSTQYSVATDIDTSTVGELSLAAPSDWLDTSWSYRQCTTIDNSSNTNALTEYQVLITGLDTAALVTAGKLKSDCSDLRFATKSGATSLDYTIIGTSCNTADTRVWVQVDSIPASSSTSLCAYYGNAAAATVESMEATFTYSTRRTVGIVGSAALATAGLSVISLADGNSISNGTTILSLDDQGTGSLTASVGTEVSASKLFFADSAAETTDMLTPISFAGTEFIHYSNRDDHFYEIYSHWGSASVTVYLDGVSFATPTIAQGSSTTVNTGSYDDRQVRITSDIPVYVHHRAGTYDSVALYPATSEDLFGVPSSSFDIAAGPSGASVSWIKHDGTSAGSPQILAANGIYELTGLPSGGLAGGYRVTTNNVIGVNQLADGDGGESTMFWPQQELGTKFGANTTLEYITVAAPEASTTCTVTNAAGGTPSNDGAGFTNPYTGGIRTDVNFLYFLFNTALSAGWKMECDKPVYAYYETDTPSDEHNMWSYPQMRQYTYPEPSLSAFAAEENNIADTGTLTSAVFDAEGDTEWGAVDFTSSGSGTVSVKVRTSSDASMSGATAFAACDAVSSGSDLSSNNCVTDGQRYVQYQVMLTEDAGASPVFEEISIAFAIVIPPAPLVADAGMDRIIVAGRSATLDGTGSTGSGLTYLWDIVDGEGSLSDRTTATPIYSIDTAAKEQNVTVLLTVSDDTGARATDEVILHVIPLTQGSESNDDITGVVGKTTLTEKLLEDSQGRERLVIITEAEAQIVLPVGTWNYALAVGDTGRLVIGIAGLDDNTGRLYVSREPVESLSGEIDLETTNKPSNLAALVVSKGREFQVITGRGADNEFGKYVAVVEWGGIEHYLISAPGELEFGKIYIYQDDMSFLGTVLGDAAYPVSSLLVADLMGSESQDIVFAPGNTALNANLQRQSLALDSSDVVAVVDGDTDFTGVSLLSALADVSVTGESYAAVAVGDVDMDGEVDLLVATVDGTVRVFLGPLSAGTDLSAGLTDIAISNPDSSEGFGGMLLVGEVSGDGLNDIVIGAPRFGDNRGAVYVVFGQEVWPSAIDTSSSANVMRVAGTDAGDGIGYDLLLADTNNDDVDEIYTIELESLVFVINLVDHSINPEGGGSSGCALIQNDSAGVHVSLYILILAALVLCRSRRTGLTS